MKILYVVFQALLGGHVLSATTIARQMHNHGVSPVFAGAEGEMSEEIRRIMPFESVEIPIFHGTRQTYFTWRSFQAIARLREIIRQHNIDLVHAFDARSYMHAYLACLQEKVPVLCTLCGGIDPYYNLPLAPVLIVFSEEQKQKMVNTFSWPIAQVQVVRTRLDLGQLLDEANTLSDGEASSLGMIPALQKLMMISSFDNTKIQSIYKVLDAAEMLFTQGLAFQLILIGGRGDLFLQAKKRGEEICQRFGAGRIIFTGPVMHAFRLLQRADVVMGVGRSAFEGMAYGKPTLIIGEKGFAGTVCAAAIQDIAWYNFSGRNLREDIAPSRLVDELRVLLRDTGRRHQVGEFGRQFVWGEIDVVQGVERLETIYQQVLHPKKSLARWRQWASLGSCLLPIILDNSVHTAKEAAKSALCLKNTGR